MSLGLIQVQAGELLTAYTAAEIAAGKTVPAGAFFLDGISAYIFLINADVAAITPGVACVSATTAQRAAFNCLIGTGGAGLTGCLYAGTRALLAANVAVGGGGWFQCKGPTTFATSTIATCLPAVIIAAGAVAAMPNTGVGASEVIGIAADAGVGGNALVYVNRNIWGI